MVRVKINCAEIQDWPSFHKVFAEKFGFPDFYGRNMDAWIDCLSDLDEPEAGMTNIHCPKGDYVLLELENVGEFRRKCPEQYRALIDCAAFVNYRNVEVGEHPLLMLSFHA
jgi:hypothetical protein